VVTGMGNYPAKTRMYFSDNSVPSGWTTVTLDEYSGVNRNFYSFMQHQSGRVIAVTNSGDVVYTDNGSEWTLYNRGGGLTNNAGGDPACIAIGDVLLNTGTSSNGGILFRSEDAGLSWTMMTGVAAYNSIRFAYGN